jgi:hypothetical protein
LPHDGKALRAVERLLPPRATVGFLLQGGDCDYTLFGEGFTRTVCSLAPWPESLSTEWFDSHEHVTHFVIHRADDVPALRLAPEAYETIETDLEEGWSVVVRTPEPTGEPPELDSGLDSPQGGT